MTRRRIFELTVMYPAAAILVFMGIAFVLPTRRYDPRLHASETAAIATLRNIASAQRVFVSMQAVDADGDGVFEYGSFRELSGAGDLRADPIRGRLDPPVLSGAFGDPKPCGKVIRSGYCFRILLPGADGQPLCPDGDPGAFGRIHAAAAGRAFLVHAWPAEYGPGMKRTFLINQDGRVFATDHGATFGSRGPLPAAGLEPEGSASLLGAIADGSPDVEGKIWVEVH